MDKALRLTRFDILPNTPSSAKEFKQWFRTFEYYLEVLPNKGLDKLKVLINFVSPEMFEYISDCTSYVSAIEIIKNVYIKPPNTTFAHHFLQLVDNNMVKHLMNIYKRLKFLQKIVIFKLSQQSSIKMKLSEMHLLTESIQMIYVNVYSKIVI